jgi:mannosyltransferase OCH1-like enzyme
MIPKKLHYCWFGNNPKSKIFYECLASWKQFCPDFEIFEWNEKNSKKYINKFYINALRKKKYAFAADYIRARVLFEFGGIYVDTDMLLVKPIDNLLEYNFFIGEEVKDRVAFGMFGCVKNHRFLKKMIDFYQTNEFNVFSPPVITHTFSPIINKETIQYKEIIYEPEYFYPLPYQNKLDDYSKHLITNSVAVHLWDHSWETKKHNGLRVLFKNWKNVLSDFLFYGYSYAYFKRYFKEFSRKIYHEVKSKKKI